MKRTALCILTALAACGSNERTESTSSSAAEPEASQKAVPKAGASPAPKTPNAAAPAEKSPTAAPKAAPEPGSLRFLLITKPDAEEPVRSTQRSLETLSKEFASDFQLSDTPPTDADRAFVASVKDQAFVGATPAHWAQSEWVVVLELSPPTVSKKGKRFAGSFGALAVFHHAKPEAPVYYESQSSHWKTIPSLVKTLSQANAKEAR